MLKKIAICLVLAVMLAAPVLALAQDGDEIIWVEYEDEDGIVKLSYPEGWFIGTDDTSPGAVAFANNEDLVERLINSGDDDDAAVEGDKGGFVFVLPVEFMAFFGVTITDDTEPLEIAEALSGIFFSEDDDAVAEFGEPELVELEDMEPVGVVSFTEESDNLEGVVLGIHRDGLLIIGLIAAATGEFDEEFRDLAIQTVMSYETSLTAEEIMQGVMGQ